jgi:hypothetical protein
VLEGRRKLVTKLPTENNTLWIDAGIRIANALHREHAQRLIRMPDPARTEHIMADIERDAMHPAREARLSTKVWKRAVRSDKRLLGGVFGIVGVA